VNGLVRRIEIDHAMSSPPDVSGRQERVM